MKKRLVAVAFLLVLAFVAFATLDEALRFLALAKYYLKDRYVIPPRTEYLDHPFLTSVLKPHQVVILPNYPGNGGGTFDFRTNALGFRSPEFSVHKPPGVYRIVVVGGSAVLTGSDNGHTFTGVLAAALNRHTGERRYEVINAGVPGFASRQELFLVTTQVITWNPDVVIVYDGRNDMFFGSMPSYRRNWVPRDEQMMAFLRKPAKMEEPVERYPFVYYLYRSRIAPPAPPIEASAAYNTPEGIPFAYAPHREAVDVYRDNLGSLVAVLRDCGIRPVLIYQPTLLGKVAHTPQEAAVAATLRPAYVEAMRAMLGLGSQAMEEVAAREHVLAADFTAIFDHEPGTMYIDDVHPTDPGNRVIAARIYALIRPMLGLPGEPPGARQATSVC